MNDPTWLTVFLTVFALLLGFRAGVIWNACAGREELTREYEQLAHDQQEIARERQAVQDEFVAWQATLDSKARADDDGDFPPIT